MRYSSVKSEFCIWFILLTVFLWSSTILADEPSSCTHEPTDQVTMNMCADEKFHKADKKLGEIYDKLMSNIDESRKQKLKDAQQTWTAFRDKECAFEIVYGYNAGSNYSQEQSDCLRELTNERIQMLENVDKFGKAKTGKTEKK